MAQTKPSDPKDSATDQTAAPAEDERYGLEAVHAVMKKRPDDSLAELLAHRVNTGMLVGDRLAIMNVAEVEAMLVAAKKAAVCDDESTPRGMAKWGRGYLTRLAAQDVARTP